MPKGVNKVKANIVKRSILEGKSYKQSCLDAGYSPNSAVSASRLAVVNNALKSIESSFKLSDITPEYVIGKLKYEAEHATRSGDRTQALALLGKYLALFKDHSIQEHRSTVDPNELNTQNLRIELTKAIGLLVEHAPDVENVKHIEANQAQDKSVES